MIWNYLKNLFNVLFGFIADLFVPEPNWEDDNTRFVNEIGHKKPHPTDSSKWVQCLGTRESIREETDILNLAFSDVVNAMEDDTLFREAGKKFIHQHRIVAAEWRTFLDNSVKLNPEIMTDPVIQKAADHVLNPNPFVLRLTELINIRDA